MTEGTENRKALILRTKKAFARTFRPDPSRIEKMEGYRLALVELARLCDRIQESDNPESEIRALVEILVQKDEAWEKEESPDDIRLVFFKLYFDNFDYRTKTLDLIRTHRFDAEFYPLVLKKIEHIREKIEHYTGSIEKDIGNERKSQKKFAREFADVL